MGKQSSKKESQLQFKQILSHPEERHGNIAKWDDTFGIVFSVDD